MLASSWSIASWNMGSSRIGNPFDLAAYAAPLHRYSHQCAYVFPSVPTMYIVVMSSLAFCLLLSLYQVSHVLQYDHGITLWNSGQIFVILPLLRVSIPPSSDPPSVVWSFVKEASCENKHNLVCSDHFWTQRMRTMVISHNGKSPGVSFLLHSGTLAVAEQCTTGKGKGDDMSDALSASRCPSFHVFCRTTKLAPLPPSSLRSSATSIFSCISISLQTSTVVGPSQSTDHC